ncbi:hypothetical protein K439DRAFT_1624503 [Ramaria rubella]|nr:hypothetical protein K439DRAFT_1624503 [Ramaria rubella]
MADGSILTVITLLVPLCLLENANKRTPVSKVSTFEAMTSEVQQALGCEYIPTKPMLMYKLFWATKSSSMDCLLDEADWHNLIKRVEEGEAKKLEVVMYIVITEKVGLRVCKVEAELTVVAVPGRPDALPQGNVGVWQT